MLDVGYSSYFETELLCNRNQLNIDIASGFYVLILAIKTLKYSKLNIAS